MIESFDVPKNKVAKWAGITSAVFSLSQCTTGVAWGRASDRFGRKPIILLGMTCTMLSSLFFGFSRSLPAAIVARSLAGASNGNVGIMRTTVAEMVPWKELQPRAFSVMPLIWTIGSLPRHHSSLSQYSILVLTNNNREHFWSCIRWCTG